MSDPCEDALHELYHFLDGELTDDRRALISTHLDDCSSCLGVFDFEAELRHVVSQRCRDSGARRAARPHRRRRSATSRTIDPAS